MTDKAKWGGKREGAGRPLTAGEVRKQRQLRATEKEWKIIKEFSKILKKEPTKANKIINGIKREISGLDLLDNMIDYTGSFTAIEASYLAAIAIKYQLDYYENNPDEVYYNYTPDILKATLKEITPKNMAVDKDTLTIKEIINRIEALTTFLY